MNTTIELPQKQRNIFVRSSRAVGRFWLWSTGFSSLGNQLGRIGSNLKGFIQQGQPREYRHETFEEAVSRMSLDEQHLIRQARSFNLIAATWFFMMCLSLLWLSLAPRSDSPLAHVLISLGLIWVCFAKSITWRFRFCQIRDQELYSFQSWIVSGKL